MPDIDLSAGMVPTQSSPAIDLSAGMVQLPSWWDKVKSAITPQALTPEASQQFSAETSQRYAPTSSVAAQATQDIQSGHPYQGANRILEGLGKAEAPLAAAGAIAAPLASAVGAGTALAGSYIANKGTEALGATTEQQRFAGNVGAIATGYGGFKLGDLLSESELSDVSNYIASKLRNPATARQAQMGKPGTVKDILPPQLQRWSVPPWMIPKGEVGTPTNPGPYAELPAKLTKEQIASLTEQGGTSVPPGGKNLILQPGQAAPGSKVTWQSYPRQTLLDIIKDPDTPYSTRIQALAEFRRNPAGYSMPSNMRYLLDIGAPTQAWRNYPK